MAQQVLFVPMKGAATSMQMVIQPGMSACIVQYAPGDKPPSETGAFSLVQTQGGPWPGELPKTVHDALPRVCVITATDWWPVTYVVKKAETDEPIGVYVEI